MIDVLESRKYLFIILGAVILAIVLLVIFFSARSILERGDHETASPSPLAPTKSLDEAEEKDRPARPTPILPQDRNEPFSTPSPVSSPSPTPLLNFPFLSF